MLPSKTLSVKADREPPKANKCKKYVTVLTCPNVSGSFRLPLSVIGKLAKPRAMKNYNFQSSPVLHKNQKSAWMDVQLLQDWFFEKFVQYVKKFLRESGLSKKALLLVDNMPSHSAITSLQCKGIVVKLLPFNMTSIAQPMN